MDGERLQALPGFRDRPLPGILAAVVHAPVQSAARGLLGDALTLDSLALAQLLHQGPPRRFRRLPPLPRRLNPTRAKPTAFVIPTPPILFWVAQASGLWTACTPARRRCHQSWNGRGRNLFSPHEEIPRPQGNQGLGMTSGGDRRDVFAG